MSGITPNPLPEILLYWSSYGVFATLSESGPARSNYLLNTYRPANQCLVELYIILRDEEKLPPEDCHIKIEYDCLDLAKDSKKPKAGEVVGENKKKAIAAAMLVAVNSNGARINLAEDGSDNQNERESRTFDNELNQKLSSRAISTELFQTTRIIANKDRKIEAA